MEDQCQYLYWPAPLFMHHPFYTVYQPFYFFLAQYQLFPRHYIFTLAPDHPGWFPVRPRGGAVRQYAVYTYDGAALPIQAYSLVPENTQMDILYILQYHINGYFT